MVKTYQGSSRAFPWTLSQLQALVVLGSLSKRDHLRRNKHIAGKEKGGRKEKEGKKARSLLQECLSQYQGIPQEGRVLSC